LRLLEFARKVEYNMGMDTYTVSLDWDGEASKWYALNDDIPIMLEDASLDALMRRVRQATPELLELNGKPYASGGLLFKMEAQAVVA